MFIRVKHKVVKKQIAVRWMRSVSIKNMVDPAGFEPATSAV